MWAISSTAKNKTFLIDVKKKRKELRIHQKVLAHELGMTQGNYSQIECGSTDLKLNDFIFICKRLSLNAGSYLI